MRSSVLEPPWSIVRSERIRILLHYTVMEYTGRRRESARKILKDLFVLSDIRVTSQWGARIFRTKSREERSHMRHRAYTRSSLAWGKARGRRTSGGRNELFSGILPIPDAQECTIVLQVLTPWVSDDIRCVFTKHTFDHSELMNHISFENHFCRSFFIKNYAL